ncbi:uncharacterized protein LOC129716893 [Wyeomyia smithii]|uniref:uncharacterized protein LOC129716893 n=1 Tax=Wyeomyia smithii TaxID=174621 RepID=UPI002467C742|nr:uncharacterized protein LOC129716893 [Wyeomyia smithii]
MLAASEEDLSSSETAAELENPCSIPEANDCQFSSTNLDEKSSTSFEEDGSSFHSWSEPQFHDDEHLSAILENLNNKPMEKFSDNLKEWALQYNIRHKALGKLLLLLRDHYDDVNLPIDPRTLLGSPKNTGSRCSSISGGKYWHQGLGNCLRCTFKDLSSDISIQLNINIDGVPLHKSSRAQFWPILANIHGMEHVKPMVIGIFCGQTKPLDVTEYLSPFVNEMIPLLQNGQTINGCKIKINIRCFICDSPARAFLKGVVNFNGIHGCLKCTTEGEYSYISRTVVFPNIHCALRTDTEFRRKIYGKHHKEDSPILKLPGFDIIKDIVIADPLHLLELGVMKRCLIGWRDGSLGFTAKLCGREIEKLSAALTSMKLPLEIHRSMRGIDCIAFRKGVELRIFLNYVGVVILKDILDERVYFHFLLLFAEKNSFQLNQKKI